MTEMVTISKREYEDLLRRDKWLDCLEASGLENWDRLEIAKDFLNSGELHVV